jgi:hypothetical protein
MGMNIASQKKFDALFFQMENLIEELELDRDTAFNAAAAMCAHLGIIADWPIAEAAGTVGMYYHQIQAENRKTSSFKLPGMFEFPK